MIAMPAQRRKRDRMEAVYAAGGGRPRQAAGPPFKFRSQQHLAAFRFLVEITKDYLPRAICLAFDELARDYQAAVVAGW
jgi:hypothetical protein